MRPRTIILFAALAVIGTVLIAHTLRENTAAAAPAAKTPDGLSATVSPPPLVQRVGHAYAVTITVRTRANAVRPFCIDFDDDHNSWLFQFPGPREYKNDVYCFPGFKAYYSKRFRIMLIPARTGQRKLGIGIGSAKFYPTINTALLNENSLYWSKSFVIVG